MWGGSELPTLGVSKWKEFYIQKTDTQKGIFSIENCKCNCAADLEDGEDVFYIGAKKNDNGVMKKVQLDTSKSTKGNCIVFICDGEGSVGYTNYQEKDFIGSTTLSAGRCDKLNQYVGLFLVAILDKEKYKFSYGRKYRNHLPKLTIKLPVKCDVLGNAIINNESPYSDMGYIPDWQFMEDYIKVLPYGDRI